MKKQVSIVLIHFFVTIAIQFLILINCCLPYLSSNIGTIFDYIFTFILICADFFICKCIQKKIDGIISRPRLLHFADLPLMIPAFILTVPAIPYENALDWILSLGTLLCDALMVVSRVYLMKQSEISNHEYLKKYGKRE